MVAFAANTATGIPGLTANTALFGFFPTIDYDINSTTMQSGSTETITDIFYRFSILKQIINNTSSYYLYNIQEYDTPDLLSEQIYFDRGAGWIILYANRIFDPQFDWPLSYDAFQAMINDKYGSLANAQSTIHHCEITVTRTNEYFGTTSTTTFVMDNNRQTNLVPNFPYKYFTPWFALTHKTADSNVHTADEIDITTDTNYDDLQKFYGSGSLPTFRETD